MVDRRSRILRRQSSVECDRRACAAADFDNLRTVRKSNIGDRIARLMARKMKKTGAAASFARGFDAE
jgi:hypothetical protein